MLDINLIREKPELVREALRKRQMDDAPVDWALDLDAQRRDLIQQVGSLKAERNAVSKEISKLKDPAERQAKIEAMRQVGERISALDGQLREVEVKLEALMAEIPNLPEARVPVGADESHNVVLKTRWVLGAGPRYQELL